MNVPLDERPALHKGYRSSDAWKVLSRELAEQGVEIEKVIMGNRHRLIVFRIDGRELRFPFSTDAKDGMIKAMRANLRRLIREARAGKTRITRRTG